MELASQDAELKAALFRFVDVVPACRSLDDLARHLTGFLGEVETPPPPVAVAMRMGNTRAGPHGARRRRRGRRQAHGAPLHRRREPEGGAGRRCASCGRTASPARSTCSARRRSRRPRRSATRRAARRRSRRSPRRRGSWPERPALERDAAGALPRANLSVKVSALTPLLRPDAPERGKRDAADRLRGLLRRARERGAHLHIDMESLDSRDAVLELVLELLAEDEFRAGPSAGMVLQAYLRDSPQTLDTVLELDRRGGRGARAAADRAARQGRLLGPRGRRGGPARLDDAGVRGQGRLGPQLRGAHAAAARRARQRLRPARRDRLAQPALDRARDRLRRALRRRRQRPRAAGPARAGRSRCSTRSPPRACACAPTARSATSSPAWPTSCGGCWRTRRTSRSSPTRPRACRSSGCSRPPLATSA